MSTRGIRALTAADLPAVCSLYERVARSGSTHPPPALVGHFQGTFLDHPWADDAMPSFVQEDRDGGVVGFIGSHVRRVRLDGRPVQVVFSGPLVAATDSPGSGAMLTRRLLSGPQDATLSDGATDYMRRIWSGLGGHTAVASSISWTKVFRPAATAEFLTRRFGRPRLSRSLHAVGPALDRAARRVLRRVPGILPPQQQAITAETLTTELLLEQVRGASRRLRLYPDYDEKFLPWVFEVLQTARGKSFRHLIRDGDGRALGWYVYTLADAGIAQVLQVAAPSGRIGDVLDHLLGHADTNGAGAALGRLEPSLLGELGPRRCPLVQTGLYSLAHTQNSTLLALLGTPQALLTSLDGAAWLGHNSRFTDAREPEKP